MIPDSEEWKQYRAENPYPPEPGKWSIYRWRGVAAAFGAAVLFWSVIGVAVYFIQEARAQVGANLPFVTGVTVQNSVTTLIAANASRRGLKICNAGTTNQMWIAPVNTTGTTVAPAVNGAGSFLLSQQTTPAAGVISTSCLNMPADVIGAGGGVGSGAVVTAGFAAITNAATTAATIWEY